MMRWDGPQVDVVFADVAQPDQSRIVALNSHMFLKNGGHFMISIKANCVDSTADPALVFAQEVNKLKAEQFKPAEQVRTLSLFVRILFLKLSSTIFLTFQELC